MNRKPAIIVFAIFALATVVIGFFMYSWYYSSQNLIGVQIIDFTVDKNWWNPVGVSYGHWFNVTVENVANNNITGLFLDIGIFLNGTKYEGFSLGKSDTSPSFNFSLNAKETIQFEGFVLASIDSPIGFGGRSPSDEIIIQARVMLNDTVLDMRSIPF
jgi:hypothetical protein